MEDEQMTRSPTRFVSLSALAMAAIICVQGCARWPESIDPLPVSTAEYENNDCHDLVREETRVDRQLDFAIRRQNAYAKSDVLEAVTFVPNTALVGLVAMYPLPFMLYLQASSYDPYYTAIAANDYGIPFSTSPFYGPVASGNLFLQNASDYTPHTVALVREAGFACACSTSADVVCRVSDRFQLPRVVVQDWDGEELALQLGEWFRA